MRFCYYFIEPNPSLLSANSPSPDGEGKVFVGGKTTFNTGKARVRDTVANNFSHIQGERQEKMMNKE